MLRISIRSVLAHKLRFLLTTLAVVTGVAFVVGAFVVTDSLRASVEDLFANINSGVDVSVRASTPIEGAGTIGLSRGRVPESLVDVVRNVDGVEVAEGTVSGYAQLLDKDGHPLKTTGAPFLGVSWGEEDELYAVKLDDGRKPVGTSEVAIDRASATDAGFSVGDRTKVLLLDGTQHDVTVVGIFTFGEREQPARCPPHRVRYRNCPRGVRRPWSVRRHRRESDARRLSRGPRAADRVGAAARHRGGDVDDGEG